MFQVIKLKFPILLFVATFANAQNSKPFVVPELREWTGSEYSFFISDKTKIIASGEAKKIARQFSADYKTMFGKNLEVKSVVSSESAIFFNINPDSLKDEGEEAYRVEIGKTIQVTANSSTGLFWATRTLLQMTEQSDKLPCGIIRDYPEYPIRGFMLDVGRKYFSLNYLKAVVKLMSYYKMNTFQIHLNDNGFKQFFDDDWNKTYGAFRLESTTYPGLAARDGYYGKEEFRQFQMDAIKQGVTIIPEIDAPAHTLAFAHYKPELGSKIYGMDHLDLFKPETYSFLDNLYKEYLEGHEPIFVNKYVHIGTDEYSNKDSLVVEKFRYFTDYYIKYIESFGKKAAMWGALTHAKGKTPVKVKDVLMACWYNGYADPEHMIREGYNLLSVPDGYLYIVPAAGYYYDYLNIKNLYENWTPAVIGGKVFEEKHPQIKGGMFAVWNDHTGNGISSQDVYHRIFPAMQTLAVKMWDGKKATLPLVEFNRKRLFLSEAPGVNMLGRPVRSAKGIVFEIRKPKHGKLLRQSLTDIGYNYRVTFDITTGNNPKGTALFSSDYSVFYITDPEQGKIGFSRDGYNYRFNYALPTGKQVRMSIEGDNVSTKLYVNDHLVETLSIESNKADIDRKNKRKYVQTLFFPLKMLNKFNGRVNNLRVEYLGEK